MSKLAAMATSLHHHALTKPLVTVIAVAANSAWSRDKDLRLESPVGDPIVFDYPRLSPGPNFKALLKQIMLLKGFGYFF